MFARALEKHGDRIAVILPGGESLAYRELAARADAAWAAVDPDWGVIALECANTLDNLLAYLGALRAGQPVLLLDATLNDALREQVIAHYCISHVRRPDGQLHATGRRAAAVSSELAVLLPTSGSTGSSKLVRLSAGNLQANARSIQDYLNIDSTQRAITSLPIHYSYGLSVVNSHLLAGATLLLTAESVVSRSFWDFFRQHEATSFSGVPTHYEMLKQFRFERMSLPSLQTMTQAGGRLAEPTIQWFHDLAVQRNQRFFVMYGQTEATARIAYVPHETLASKIGSVGIAIPGGLLSLVDEQGQVIERAGDVGELRYRGPNVMLGYADGPHDLALGDSQQGVLSTGDLARFDDDGYYYVVGRLKRMIKVFGNRFGLDEMESTLRADGWDAVMTGRDDLIVAVLARSDGDACERLRQEIAARYKLNPVAVRVLSVDTIPLSSSGKILYADLLQQAEASQGATRAT
ncbi:TPA: AMP-binding protein [Stenotrophomonas maltophilia]|nr:AMP-binding protein [Stenotrophomonas maltophilia]